jgi:hypothetical protein
MLSDELDNLWPMYDIQWLLLEIHNIEVSLTQLQGWEGKPDVGFPEPARQLSRYKFYDIDEVAEWITLWRRATSRMGNPEGLKNNGKR